MPLQATSGAASYDAFGGGVPVVPAYIEECFSCFLYTGTGATQTITNGIDLAGKGGLVWQKCRSNAVKHRLFSTAFPVVGDEISSNSTAEISNDGSLTAYSSTGFSIGSSISDSGRTYTSWTFRKQPKFFDVVTYTGNGTSGRTVAHNLGSVPGCIIVKRTSGDPIDWLVYHRGTDATSPQNYDLKLNTTAARVLQSGSWNDTAPTSTVFTLGDSGTGNTNGETYVAYLFAHNAGGFGLTGTDNVISCGSFTTNGSGNATVSLGYEPQWVMYKRTNAASNWVISDVMRGSSLTTYAQLYADSSGAEDSGAGSFGMIPNATGFNPTGILTSSTYIYIAIRRGPMAVPTVGTSVFAPIIYTGNGSASRVITTGIKTDLIIGGDRGSNGVGAGYTNDRLRGQVNLITNDTAAEAANVAYPTFDLMTGYNNLATGGAFNATGFSYIRWAFQRAPSFFDEVCYTGTGSATTINHNLGVVPEMMIVKQRNSAFARVWVVYTSAVGNTKYLVLNTNVIPVTSADVWSNTTPTASVFSIGIDSYVNDSSTATYVAYLFATCAGVSKVGSYTGTGATQTISCGFTGGARFVLVKRTDSTGDWYVWDTARGMVSGTDPSLLLNSTAAEVNANSIYTATGGFQIVSTAAGINASGGSYIFLAIA
jgi:hypothetical protein